MLDIGIRNLTSTIVLNNRKDVNVQFDVCFGFKDGVWFLVNSHILCINSNIIW
jgi:hypothetical protein